MDSHLKTRFTIGLIRVDVIGTINRTPDIENLMRVNKGYPQSDVREKSLPTAFNPYTFLCGADPEFFRSEHGMRNKVES